MTTTIREDKERWLQKGRELGATHMLVVCDTFDWEDYPVYVFPPGKARSEHDETDVGLVIWRKSSF